MKNVVKLAMSLTLVWHGSSNASEPGSKYRKLWVYGGCNFQLNKDADRFIDLLRRSKAAGYNGMVFDDPKIARLAEPRPARWFANVERTRQEAAKLGIELIPRVTTVGYSNSILSNNPNLAEGVPVRDCLFKVRNGRATIADPSDLLAGGSFEQFTNRRPDGWDWADGPGQSVFQDRAIKHTGNSSMRMEKYKAGNPHGLCRVVKSLRLQPWHEYHLSLWIRTENVARPSTIRVVLLADVSKGSRRNLCRQTVGVRSTQDWRKYDVVFNPFQHEEVALYVGAWDAREGKIWIDDVSLRPIAGVNMLRRDGCPIHVTSEDGNTEYVEGQDFERWHYPQTGRIPYAGQYQAVHPEPPIVLTADTSIREGQTLKVSFYHTIKILHGHCCCCLRSDELFDHMEQHARRVKKLFHAPKTYFMKHDEIRLAGWCGLCNVDDMTTGQILAENVKRCADIIRRVEPDAEIVVWSDMFDPYHNAVDNYWHTRGTLKGSWEGLDPSIVIGNWNQGKRDPSLEFFAKRGHKQIIATYYDRSNWQEVVARWLRSADKFETVDGVMYTTWSSDYSNLEEFMRIVCDHPHRTARTQSH